MRQVSIKDHLCSNPKDKLEILELKNTV